MLQLLQVCNVGRIVGGTAACAWTVTRALPQFDHAVAFLGEIASETRDAFSHCRVMRWERVDAAAVAALRPDVVLLHNTPLPRWRGPLPAVSIQYLHSKTTPAPADLTLYCSRWLARQYDADRGGVLLQGVPRPRPHGDRGSRRLQGGPVVGRICTPQRSKWPDGTPAFYADLAGQFPQVWWEFVGCPDEMQPPLEDACRGRAAFLPASWEARGRLWHWDALLYHNPRLTESFGRTVAEAMRAGCIPIVDARGGFTEQVADGCGFLSRSVPDFAQAVAKLHCREHRQRISQACRAHADEHFSLARFGTELLGWFRNV